MIYSVGVNYRDCGTESLGKRSRELQRYIEDSGLRNYVFLDTCNRAELYSSNPVTIDGFRSLRGEDSLRHLFRVACGLESMFVGENEILAQIRGAYRNALDEGHCSEELSIVVRSACNLGKRVRAKTQISRGKTSIASIAVDYALKTSYPKERIAIIGSGSMGSKIAHALRYHGTKKIFLANRRIARARELAKKVKGKVIHYNELPGILKEVSIVFTATSAPHSIIRPKIIPEGREILFIDLAIPYDVSKDVDTMKGMRVVRQDFFMNMAEKNIKEKRGETKKVEQIVEENVRRFQI